MPRRIDIELTSALSDGSWTWRAAGARNPKGTVESSILPDGAKVGDELKVEIEQGLDGMEILSVVRGREKSGPDLLELLPVEENFQAVIETRAKRDRSERRGGRDGGRDAKRGRRDGRGGRDGGGRDGGDRPRGEGRDGERGNRRPHFEAPPEVPKRPKPKRLRPGKERRNEVLASIPEEQRGIAELALQGMPAVRSRLAEDNKKLAADGKPTMPEASVLKMAEDLLPKLRVADWLDRAEAAQRQMENLDLRDIRSVVAAGDDPVVARDESTRAINEQLKKDLAKKQDQELKLWLEDVDASLEVGRSIRALRLSSQPPKAGVMFPPELARKLGAAATAGLTPDDSADRWAAVMEAAAFSPVRTLVTPTAPPHQITDDLRKTALRLGPLLPQIAALLGVEVPAGAPRPKPLRPNYGKDKKKDGGRRDGGERNDRGPRGQRTDRDRNDRDGRDRNEDARAKADAAPRAQDPRTEQAPAPAPEPDVEQIDAETPSADVDAPATEPAEALTAETTPAPEPESAAPAAGPDTETETSTETAPETATETSTETAPETAPAAEPDAAAEPAEQPVPEPDAEKPAESTAATNTDEA